MTIVSDGSRTNTQQRIGAYSWHELITHPEKAAAAAAATAHWLQVDLHVLRSNPVPDAKRFQIDFLIISSCYENTVLFAQYATLIQITLQ